MIAQRDGQSPAKPTFTVYELQCSRNVTVNLATIAYVEEGKRMSAILHMNDGTRIETDVHVADVLDDLVKAGLLDRDSIPDALLKFAIE